jgi:hypothetical protein
MRRPRIFQKAFLCLLLPFVSGTGLYAQQNPAPQKFALVIGNGAYANLSRLNNPANDANDMAAALSELGFAVDKLLCEIILPKYSQAGDNINT